MTDSRWIEVYADVASSIRHVTMAADLSDSNGLTLDRPDQYWSQMGLMHAILSGHTSLENTRVRLLDLLGETQPTGALWHADLIARAARPTGNRPHILPDALVEAASETLRARHIALRGYDSFKPSRAAPAIAAARLIASTVHPAITAFQTAIDP